MKRCKFIGKSIFAITILLSVFGCSSSKKTNTEDGKPQKVTTDEPTDILSDERSELISDIETAKNIILDTPGTEEYLSDEEITTKFTDIINDVREENIDREGCYQRIRTIISELHCAHMRILTKPDDPIYQKCLNVTFQWFGDELRLSSCTDENKQYLGLKVTKISDYPVTDVVAKFATINSYETDTGEMASLENILWDTDLSYLGLLNEDNDGVEITVEDENGTAAVFTAKLDERDVATNYITDYFSSTAEMPISYRNLSMNQNYCFEGDTAHHTMYFLYTSCSDMEGYTLAQCVEDMIKEMKSDGSYTNLIIDIRWNGGGNRFVMQDLLDQYKDELNSKQISLIVGKDTYSAAFQLIADCLDRFDNVKIFGEKTGQAVHHYTEISENDLSALNCYLDVPTVQNTDPILTEKYGDIKDGITPDVEVYQSYQDYLDGVDSIYDCIIADM